MAAVQHVCIHAHTHACKHTAQYWKMLFLNGHFLQFCWFSFCLSKVYKQQAVLVDLARICDTIAHITKKPKLELD